MDDLGFRIEGRVVARLVIDRVEKRNALTRAMWEALPGLLAELAADDAVNVLLVTGAGPSFSAGADIRELISGDDPADPMAELRAFNLRAQAALREFPKPTIAVVRGHCIGGGLLTGEDADAQAVRRYRETIASGELAEGIAAFTEKRSPAFPWHSG